MWVAVVTPLDCSIRSSTHFFGKAGALSLTTVQGGELAAGGERCRAVPHHKGTRRLLRPAADGEIDESRRATATARYCSLVGTNGDVPVSALDPRRERAERRQTLPAPLGWRPLV